MLLFLLLKHSLKSTLPFLVNFSLMPISTLFPNLECFFPKKNLFILGPHFTVKVLGTENHLIRQYLQKI